MATLRVMTRNLYVGSEFAPVMSAATPEEALAAVPEVHREIVESDFASRAERVAAEIADEIDLPEGKELIREGEPGRQFFVLLDGRAEVKRKGRRINMLGAGDFFGEISLLDRGPRTATVTADSPITMLALTAWTFRGLVEQHPTIALNMLKVVAERLRNAQATDT